MKRSFSFFISFTTKATQIIRKMAPVIERVTESVELGEGPHWDAKTKSLYFVDLPGRAIHKFTPHTKKLTRASIDAEKTVSVIIPVEGTEDKFLISKDSELAVITWDGLSEKPTKTEIVTKVDIPNFVFNDGKVDSTGRFWIGGHVLTKEIEEFEPKGFLFNLNSTTKQLQKHLDGIRISNGITWSPNYDKLYYIDSLKKTIDQFDYNIKNGTLSARKSIFSLEKHGIRGYPDGQTVDTDGNLWVAIYEGNCVIQINPNEPETLLQTVQLPTKQVTSLTFGGANLDELYVTTGSVNLDTPINGSMYKITGTGSKGFDGVKVRI